MRMNISLSEGCELDEELLLAIMSELDEKLELLDVLNELELLLGLDQVLLLDEVLLLDGVLTLELEKELLLSDIRSSEPV